MRLAVPLELDASAFATWRRDSPIVDLGGETMGTTWQVKIAAPPGFDRTAIRKAIETRLDGLLAQMSHWRDDSVLGRFNQAEAGVWSTLPTAFAHVMAAAIDVAERSSGAFDPAIGALVNLWGHGPYPIERLPTPAEVNAARGVSGHRRITFEADSGRLRQPGGLRLDLSGIAKGFAVDAVADLLRAHGCDHALVEIGGELAGLGLRPDGDPWWVDLETPGKAIAPLRVALHQLAVATSGDYVRGCHTIDPRSGHPVEHAASISVIHRSAMLADAWATALSVHTPATMQLLAVQEDLPVRALTRDGAALREWISPALARLMAVAQAG